MSERREPPSPRRLREARRRGEAAVSRTLGVASALALGLAALVVTVPGLVGELSAALRRAIGAAGAGVDGAEPLEAWREALFLLARLALPPCLAAGAGALLSGAVQTGGLFALAAASLRWERLGLRAGLSRLFSAERLTALALSTLQAAALVLAGAWLAREALLRSARLPLLGPAAVAGEVATRLLRSLLALVALLALAGGAELLLARSALRRRLFTTRDEALRERRQEEGDPRLVAERRRLHRALAAAGQLRQATCLVVNPTHVAVALRHGGGTGEAPVVVAKGVGREAARLRALARRAGVPVVRDVALARALLRLAEVGDEIPEELYQAAAAVLVHLHAAARGDTP